MGDFFGDSIASSQNGTTLLISAVQYFNDDAHYAGYVQIYDEL